MYAVISVECKVQSVEGKTLFAPTFAKATVDKSRTKRGNGEPGKDRLLRYRDCARNDIRS